MVDIINHSLLINQFIPHGHCYLWKPELVGLHILSDALTAIAYFSIPAMLVYFVKKRHDVPFHWIFLLFGAFIVACGVTHVMDIWTLWFPTYWISGLVKAIAAFISCWTALSLLPLIPLALALPSPAQLEAANSQLLNEITERQRVELKLRALLDELEIRVAERTHELTKSLKELSNIKFALDESAIVAITDRHGTITYVNEKFCSISKYSIEELLGKDHRIINSGYHSKEFFKQMWATISRGKVWKGEIKNKAKDGTNYWVDTTIVPLLNVDGKSYQYIAIRHDITARKSVESELQSANKQLSNWVKELETRNQETAQMSKLSDMLQACLSIEEAHEVIAKLVQPLFPDVSGGVFIINSSKRLVEAVATWGDTISSMSQLFTPNECWALRRGQVHWVDNGNCNVPCKHLHHNSCITESLCVPMMAQGEAMGVLHLNSQIQGKLNTAKQNLAITVAEHIALALANMKLHEAIQYQSVRDPLTGLFNRRYLEESLEREFARAEHQKQALSIIMLDVDHFKQFNDTFGHNAGDMVLRELGTFLHKQIRSSDIACRYGGEEIILILPEAPTEVAKSRAELIREGVKHLLVENHSQAFGSLTVSLGIATFPQHGKTPEMVIAAADAALYRAKKEGRDRVVLA
ncbi:diguanylate cyclase [Scytonema sp. UIC 10036]|uniref:sensor domain-containing diguanylate cyclase n=1 Tax=Scytonema sp. UIC 10036 TaxID=2304196 RepID=UPI0012DA651C|nr:diguanylate cyclase [Scytonema sp. UIC 10036]MUG99034.1 diguanylate cyclase [Scytonema sp. UIC 10036]